MKIGINLMLFAGSKLSEFQTLLPRLRQIGYDHIELPVFEHDHSRFREVGILAAENGLSISLSSALPPNASLVESSAQVQAALEFHRLLVETAHIVHADLIVGPLYHPVGAIAEPHDQSELQKRLTGVLADKVASIYSQSGLRFALEPLNRFETNVVNTCSDAARICDQIGAPWLGVLTDTFHQHIEEVDPATPLLELKHHWIHSHASECNRGPAGSGQVAWEQWARTLLSQGPDLVVFESFGAAIPHLAAATRIWRDLTGDLLNCAETSFRFLHTKLNPSSL